MAEDVLLILAVVLVVLMLTAEVKMMNHVIIRDQSSRGKDQNKKECFSLFYSSFFFIQIALILKNVTGFPLGLHL